MNFSCQACLFLPKFQFMPDFHELKVKEVQKETHNAVSILFEIPDHLKADYFFDAGQYLTIKTNLNGEEIRRDYSLCTKPDSAEIKVVVKEVENVTFSKYANSDLKAGDILEVGTPQGRFTFKAESSAQRIILGIAAGSGITPVMGILSTVLQNEHSSKFILLYGNKSPKDTIFFEQLTELKEAYPDSFEYVPVYSQLHEGGAFFGRIDRSYILNTLNRLGADEQLDAIYLCGPKPMIDLSIEVLKEKGYSDEQIKYELFTSPADTSNDNQVSSVAEGKCKVEVIVDEEEFNFEMDTSQTILEAALKHDVDAPYSCQGGICSSCIAKIREGSVNMRQNNILTDSEVEEGFILTCQAEPTSSKVVVDYDDV